MEGLSESCYLRVKKEPSMDKGEEHFWQGEHLVQKHWSKKDVEGFEKLKWGWGGDKRDKAFRGNRAVVSSNFGNVRSFGNVWRYCHNWVGIRYELCATGI